jgi:hypothetical protein
LPGTGFGRGVQHAQLCVHGSVVAIPTVDNRKVGSKAVLISLLVRYMLLAIPLVILSDQSERFNLPATVVGIFMVQLVIMIEHGSRLIFTSVKH